MISRGELGADDGFPLACPESEAGDEAEPLPAVDERLLAILAPFVYDTGGDVIDAERTLPYDASLVARVTGRWLLLTRMLCLRNGLGSSDLGISLSMISWFNE